MSIGKDELNKRIKAEWEDFSKEVERCEDCKNIERENKNIIPCENYCDNHQQIYRDMEGCVI